MKEVSAAPRTPGRRRGGAGAKTNLPGQARGLRRPGVGFITRRRWPAMIRRQAFALRRERCQTDVDQRDTSGPFSGQRPAAGIQRQKKIRAPTGRCRAGPVRASPRAHRSSSKRFVAGRPPVRRSTQRNPKPAVSTRDDTLANRRPKICNRHRGAMPDLAMFEGCGRGPDEKRKQAGGADMGGWRTVES